MTVTHCKWHSLISKVTTCMMHLDLIILPSAVKEVPLVPLGSANVLKVVPRHTCLLGPWPGTWEGLLRTLRKHTLIHASGRITFCLASLPPHDQPTVDYAYPSQALVARTPPRACPFRPLPALLHLSGLHP